jgi:hypothetical protein
MQRHLAANQIQAFYHKGFVQQQVEHFRRIALPYIDKEKVVVDIGGGCGYFAAAISADMRIGTRVLDTDPVGIEFARKIGLDAVLSDAVQPIKKQDEGTACFNLILHHLVGASEKDTKDLQVRSLSAWNDSNVSVFVSEYVYESWLPDFSGWLIFQITRNKTLSAIGSLFARFFPSLKANTFGVGVRFRSSDAWKAIFINSGFSLKKEIRGEKEDISKPRRLLLIKEIRRDSFFLVPI